MTLLSQQPATRILRWSTISVFLLQEEALKVHRPLVVVGTPGRLAELSRAGALLTHHTGAGLNLSRLALSCYAQVANCVHTNMPVHYHAACAE